MEKEDRALIIFSAIFVVSLVLTLTGGMTGRATEQFTKSNVTIEKYLSITLSTNLQEGIDFGTVVSLPMNDVNASHNWDGDLSRTTMWVNSSLDGNTAIDFCIKASGNLETEGMDIIGLGNETYSYSTTNNATLPAGPDGSTSLTQSYVKTDTNVAKGVAENFRFWLDLIAALPAGTYNNTVYFKGVPTGNSC